MHQSRDMPRIGPIHCPLRKRTWSQERKSMRRCARSATAGRTLGRAFTAHLSIPRLATHPPQYTEAELFWIIKHGVRNTAMPAWGRQLSDENIWQVVAFLKRLDSLQPAVTAEREKRSRGAADQ